MSFRSLGHLRSRDMKKRYISTSAGPMATKMNRWWLTIGGHHPMVSWHKSHLTNKKVNIYFYRSNDYQTRQGGGLWYWVTTHKVTWFFDHVIMKSCAKRKTYLQLHKSYEHQTWHGGGAWNGATFEKLHHT